MYRTLFICSILLPFSLLAQKPTAEDHLLYAKTAYAADDMDQAKAHADSALTMDSGVQGGFKLRGDIKQRQGDLHGALTDYVKAEKVDDTDPRLYVSRSAVHITEGHLKEAMRDVDRALDLDKNDPDAWYNRACANYLGQNNDGALRDIEKALELRPENADAFFLRGVLKGEVYKEEAGIVDIQEALRLKPTIPGGAMSLAVLLFEDEQYDKAIEKFTDVITLDDKDKRDAHYYRADCYYEQQNKEKACDDFRVAAQLGDGDAKFIVRNYCNSDLDKIPKKPVKSRRKSVIEF